jgi:hypothetical protein
LHGGRPVRRSLAVKQAGASDPPPCFVEQKIKMVRRGSGQKHLFHAARLRGCGRNDLSGASADNSVCQTSHLTAAVIAL